MAGTTSKKTKRKAAHLIEIRRHVAGPPRRSPGQRLWLTPQQIKQEGLKKGDDYQFVE